MVWIWETYIQDRLNGGASTCRKCLSWVLASEDLKACEEFNSCKDPSCDYCDSCSIQHCKDCHYNHQMANLIRASESYQQVLREFWEQTNWNPLPWAAEFYENEYNFARYYLGEPPTSGSGETPPKVLAYISKPPSLERIQKFTDRFRERSELTPAA